MEFLPFKQLFGCITSPALTARAVYFLNNDL